MEMTKKEFASHFSDSFTPEIKSFGKETLLEEGFDCLIVTDREDKEKAYCTHCKKFVKIPRDNMHSGSPKTAWRRERDSQYCTAAYLNIPEEERQRRMAIKARKNAECPFCKKRLSVYHQWRMDMSQLDGVASISVWAKSKVDSAAVVMRRIEIDRQYGNDADHIVKDTFVEAERYLFRMGHKTIRQNCQYRETKYKNGAWRSRTIRKFVKSIRDSAFRQTSIMYYDKVEGHYRMDVGSLLKATDDTPYQYLFQESDNYISCYDKYEHRVSYPLYVVNYMDLYSLHPWIELLIKNGMENLVMEHIRGNGCKGAICWSAKSIKSAVKRFQKQDLKDIAEYNRQAYLSGRRLVTETDLAVLAQARERMDSQLKVEQAVKLAREGYGTFDRMCTEAERLGLPSKKVLEYCYKEGGIGHAIGDWLDYIQDAEKIGLNLGDRTNSMPKDLKKRHANVIKQIKYRESKELEEKLKATLAVRNKIFCWKGKKYFIRPAGSTKELIAEGKALHHCVGGYAERHAKGETNILFVRENESPDKPLYTMEVTGSVKSGWKLEQIRANMNAAPPEDVMKMVKRFMERINTQGKEKKVRKTA